MAIGYTNEDAVWWTDKLRKLGPKAVGRNPSSLAVSALADLALRGSQSVHLDRFVERASGDRNDALAAIALLYRYGFLTWSVGPGLELEVHLEKLALRKSSARPKRTRLRQALRTEIVKADDRRCASCGATFEKGNVDHVVPLALMGADSLANLVASCSRCNRLVRWHDLVPIRWYRGEPVDGRIGLHLHEQRLWPVINGLARVDG